jgi:hypothetical protein
VKCLTNFAGPLEFAFYIDGKGRRKRSGFLIEWEGQPESFAFAYPYVLAFEPNFIEVCHMLTVSYILCKLCRVSQRCNEPYWNREQWNKSFLELRSNVFHRL